VARACAAARCSLISFAAASTSRRPGSAISTSRRGQLA
jgi:hypothetical protein